MLRGELIISKLVQRILKIKTHCADVFKAKKQEITYKEGTYRLKNKKSLRVTNIQLKIRETLYP